MPFVLLSTAVLEEKAAAMMAIGIYAEVSLAAFAPYLDEALRLAAGMSEYFHEDLREQAYTSMPSLLKACLAAFPAPSGVFLLALHSLWYSMGKTEAAMIKHAMFCCCRCLAADTTPCQHSHAGPAWGS